MDVTEVKVEPQVDTRMDSVSKEEETSMDCDEIVPSRVLKVELGDVGEDQAFTKEHSDDYSSGNEDNDLVDPDYENEESTKKGSNKRASRSNDKIRKSTKVTVTRRRKKSSKDTQKDNDQSPGKVVETRAHLKHNVRLENGQEIFECVTCQKTYGSLKSFKAHSYNHKGIHICQLCQARFSRSSNLKVHLRRHAGDKPFACHLCDSKFSVNGELTRHLLSHTGERPFKCPQCDSCFSQKGHLDKHLRSHSSDKPFLCSICGACYTYKNNLNFHLRKHTGVKPYNCLLCPAEFWEKKNLQRHARRAHNETNVELDKSFELKSAMLKCTICKSSFRNEKNLAAHMMIHSMEGKDKLA